MRTYSTTICSGVVVLGFKMDATNETGKRDDIIDTYCLGDSRMH